MRNGEKRNVAAVGKVSKVGEAQAQSRFPGTGLGAEVSKGEQAVSHAGGLEQLDALRLRSFEPLAHGHPHALVLAEMLRPSLLQDAGVQEHVLTAAIRDDEAKALPGVEPFHSALERLVGLRISVE